SRFNTSRQNRNPERQRSINSINELGIVHGRLFDSKFPLGYLATGSHVAGVKKMALNLVISFEHKPHYTHYNAIPWRRGMSVLQALEAYEFGPPENEPWHYFRFGYRSGYFVSSVDGILPQWVDPAYFDPYTPSTLWLFSLNGTPTTEGLEKLKVQDGDTLTFDYSFIRFSKFDSRTQELLRQRFFPGRWRTVPRSVLEARVRTGNPIEPKRYESDVDGRIKADDFGKGWFHQFGLSILNFDPEDLRFEYQCAFWQKKKKKVVNSKLYRSGESCPAQEVSDKIRAIRLKLEGARKGEYRLNWSGEVAFKGPNPSKPYPNLKSGDWCGTPEDGGGAEDEWVNKLYIQIVEFRKTSRKSKL
ncbi:DUF4430 domain-containing protein, partial [Taklimakanibacter deserti]|uniref:DUF4430 domain-containing protein n=1 Tax=Taklimakanibacter deserti TaxID=2267839 RepID=UPI0034D72709